VQEEVVQRVQEGVARLRDPSLTLSPQERQSLISTLTDLAGNLTAAQAVAIEQAHRVGQPPYTTPEIATKTRILRAAGFSALQVRALLKGRVAGEPHRHDAFLGSRQQRELLVTYLRGIFRQSPTDRLEGYPREAFAIVLTNFTPSTTGARAAWLRALGFPEWVFRVNLEERDATTFAATVIDQMNHDRNREDFLHSLLSASPRVDWRSPDPRVLVREIRQMLALVRESGARNFQVRIRLEQLIPLAVADRQAWLRHLGFESLWTELPRRAPELRNFATELFSAWVTRGEGIEALLTAIERDRGFVPAHENIPLTTHAQREASRRSVPWTPPAVPVTPGAPVASDPRVQPPAPARQPPAAPPAVPPAEPPSRVRVTVLRYGGGGSPSRPIRVQTTGGVFVIRRQGGSRIYCRKANGIDYTLDVENADQLLVVRASTQAMPVIRVREDGRVREIKESEIEDAIRAR
jgi:hypothetical protein